MCCEPSKCELKYNPDQNPDKRCCTEGESKLHCQNIAVNARDVNIIQQLLPLQQQKHMIV